MLVAVGKDLLVRKNDRLDLNCVVAELRKPWTAPDLRKIAAADAEDNPGVGADGNGRVS